MKLISLVLKNFKGIKSLELKANGENIMIFGDNATGKTTVFDAFLWLLFDKDSQNRKDFAIKTLDKSGVAKNHLDHEVEGTFSIEGETVAFRKIYREKWTRKRGSATDEFTGHETDYFVDGVPVKKAEYMDRIAQMAPEETFKLLTSPTYFNEQLHWQDRRRTLLEVCGDISDEEVIKSNPKLDKLPEILGKRTIDDHKKVIIARRTEINKELERIPIRIDEVTQNMPDISAIDEPETIDVELQKLSDARANKEAELAKLISGGAVGDKKQRIAVIKSELLTIETDYKRVVSEKKNAIQNQIDSITTKIYTAKKGLDSSKSDLADYRKTVESAAKNMAELRAEWHKVNAEQPEICVDESCPYCERALPPDKIEAARAKAISDFNLKKAARLEKINADGKEKKREHDEAANKILIVEKHIAALESKIAELNDECNGFKEQLEVLIKSTDGYKEIDEYKELVAEQEQIQKVLDGDQSAIKPEKVRLEAEIDKLEKTIDMLNSATANLELHAKSEKRIVELQAQETILAQEFERLEKELFLIEEFIRTKVDMLTNRINSKFKHARFKLFETQINGGITEVCETIFNGVPYSSGLNNAARINVGLDIINTLSEHYGFSAPIFVDNAEAVTQLIPVNGQLISLIVSEKDKSLRIETPAEDTADPDGQQKLFEEAV